MNDVFAANKLVRDAGEVTNSYIYIKSWIGKYGYMYRDIQMIRAIMYGDGAGDRRGLLQHRVHAGNGGERQKRRHRGAAYLGAKDGFIRAIFIWYGLLAGLLGSLSGVVIGVIASLQLTNIIRGIEKLVGHSFLSGDIYFIDFLPSELHWLDVLIVLATAIVLSLLASWYPAGEPAASIRRGC